MRAAAAASASCSSGGGRFSRRGSHGREESSHNMCIGGCARSLGFGARVRHAHMLTPWSSTGRPSSSRSRVPCAVRRRGLPPLPGRHGGGEGSGGIGGDGSCGGGAGGAGGCGGGAGGSSQQKEQASHLHQVQWSPCCDSEHQPSHRRVERSSACADAQRAPKSICERPPSSRGARSTRTRRAGTGAWCMADI